MLIGEGVLEAIQEERAKYLAERTCPQCHADLTRHAHKMSCTHEDDKRRKARADGLDVAAIVEGDKK